MPSRLANAADICGPILAAWLDASDGATITQSAGTISQVADKSVSSGARSGAPNHATQSTASAQPGYSSTGFPGGGMPAILAGQGLWLDLTTGIGFSPTDGQSAMAVTGNIEVNATQTLYSNYQNSGAPDLRINNNNQIELNRSYQANLITSSGGISAGATARHLIGHDAISGSSTVYADGVGTTGSADPAFGAMLATLLREQNEGEYFLSAVGEIIVTSRKLTTAERQKLEGYLAWKWDGGTASVLVGQLPADHPYKSAAPTVATGGATFAEVISLAQAADLTGAGAIRAAQAATLAAALSVATNPGAAAYASTLALATTAVAAAAARSTATGPAVLAVAAALTGANRLAGSGAMSLAQVRGAGAGSTFTGNAQAAIAAAAVLSASNGGAQAYIAAMALAATVLDGAAARGSLSAAVPLPSALGLTGAAVGSLSGSVPLPAVLGLTGAALGSLSGSVPLSATLGLTGAARGSLSNSVPLPAALGLTGSAAGLYLAAVALARVQGQDAQTQAVAVAAAAMAQAAATAASPGPQAWASAVALATAALQAANAPSGQAALMALATQAGATSTAGRLTSGGAVLANAAGGASTSILSIAAGATFSAVTQAATGGRLTVTGTLSLPSAAGVAGRSGGALNAPVRFTAVLDEAAASTVGAVAAAQFAASAALEALFQVGDPYAAAPQLRGLRTVTLTLDGRRMGTRTLAGTMRLMIGPSRN